MWTEDVLIERRDVCTLLLHERVCHPSRLTQRVLSKRTLTCGFRTIAKGKTLQQTQEEGVAVAPAHTLLLSAAQKTA